MEKKSKESAYQAIEGGGNSFYLERQPETPDESHFSLTTRDGKISIRGTAEFLSRILGDLLSTPETFLFDKFLETTKEMDPEKTLYLCDLLMLENLNRILQPKGEAVLDSIEYRRLEISPSNEPYAGLEKASDAPRLSTIEVVRELLSYEREPQDNSMEYVEHIKWTNCAEWKCRKCGKIYVSPSIPVCDCDKEEATL